MQMPEVTSKDLELYSDAAGGVGFGLFCGGAWCAERWPEEWAAAGITKNITLLELFPLVVACELWADVFRNRRVVFWCDNLGVVEVVNRQAARCLAVNSLMRELVLRCLRLNLYMRARHVPGFQNGIADALSRFNFLQFRRLAPEARAEGLPMPAHLWNLVRKESGRCSAYSSGSRYSLWIVGHSYVHWAAERALIRPGGRHLGLGSQGLRVSWWGQRGMRWSQLLLLMERLRSRPRHPDILLIHLGGNDVDSCSGKDLINTVKDDLRVVLDWFPSVLLVWSDIVPRPRCLASRRWTRGLAKLNRQVGKWVMGQGGLQLLHDWVDVSCAGLFHSDGVHLSAVGWDLLLDDFASGCERVLATR
uniref:Uncharacterized protein LOC117349008 isoform X1 n=1 Tax=Geotrypetes seraphini TaxID=260995 RepID=A0A6P8PA44_GEOSA|nr:uncharacterized protein LOC117349008 isoform X1 [Geotrypetes seraphini]